MHSTKIISTKHLRRTKIWNTYYCMKQRCLNKTSLSYKNYGKRGVHICDRWLESIFNFIDDMGEPPSAQHSIGRIDNDGDYCPENCRWETPKQQANNRRKAPSREIHPNSLANLRAMTTETARATWNGARSSHRSVPKICDICKESFHRRGATQRGNHVYCSRKCYGVSVKIRRADGSK